MTDKEISDLTDLLDEVQIKAKQEQPKSNSTVRTGEQSGLEIGTQNAKLEDVAQLIKKSKKILIVTGAGISVSCGIPDFRSAEGIYAQLEKRYPALRTPTDMFNIQYFKADPRAFFDFAVELWPGNFKPSRTHQFMKKLNQQGQLLRNYTQNIDTLEQVAGIDSEVLIQCHGSFENATCQLCGKKYKAEDIKEAVFKKEIPYCTSNCSSARWSEDILKDSMKFSFFGQPQKIPVIKPDIVFFGEGLPDKFHNCCETDPNECDLLIVIGSSLLVSPVNLIPGLVDKKVPKILINKEELRYQHNTYTYELYGYCDTIMAALEEIMYETTGGTPKFKPVATPEEITSSTFISRGHRMCFEGSDAKYILT